MSKSRHIMFIICLCLYSFKGLTQFKRKVDSLHALMLNVPDTQKVQVLGKITRLYIGNNPDSGLYFADSVLRFSQKINYQRGVGEAYSMRGHAYNTKGKYDAALNEFLQALKVFEKIGNLRGVSNCNNSIGNVYAGYKDYAKAVNYYEESFHIAKDLINDTYMMAIASVGVANCAIEVKDLNKAKTFLLESKMGFHKLGLIENEATVSVILANVFKEQKEYRRAEEEIREVLPLLQKLDDKYALGSAYDEMGALKMAQNKWGDARDFLEKAYEIHLSRKAWDNIESSARYLSEAYEQLNNPNEALKYYKIHTQYKDSVINIERNKSLADVEAKYQTEKKEQQLKLNALELSNNKKTLEGRNRLLYVASGALLIFGILVIVILRSNAQRKKANSDLARKNHEVVIKSKEIEHQKNIIEAKNKDITDSIIYARHIQRALLPFENYVKELLPDSFILYKPKDIVSGDFYFVQKQENCIYLAVIDCTGHGVPGAILSILANSTLKNIISSDKGLMPAEILKRLCIEFQKNLTQYESGVPINDGMDMAICCLDMEKNELIFSGAKNPVLIVRGNEMIELKGDKSGIGSNVDLTAVAFNNSTVSLQRNDLVYLFTDGFSDQFGGPKGKKMRYKHLKDTLMLVKDFSVNKQKETLNSFFEEWKGELEQVDDVTLMGFKIS